MTKKKQGRKKTEWYGLYGDSWKGEITDASFRHPAKFSRALVRQIYKHCLEKGYLKRGDKVIDPFGGVALGALDALRFGLDWRGVELEPAFVALGQGFDCPGFDVTFWRRYQGRGGKWQALGVCPDCGGVLNGCVPMLHWFGRASRKIPVQAPHRYSGNIGLWERYGLPGTAELLQGDSRRLAMVLGAGQGAISSPPYTGQVINSTSNGIDWDKAGRPDRAKPSPARMSPGVDGGLNYGETSGQLGAMKDGDFVAAISSPPYASGEKGHPSLGSVNKDDWGRDGRDIAGRRGVDGKYGETPGQLSAMKEDDFAAVIGSPPYGDAVSGQGEGPGARFDTVYHSDEAATKKSNQNEYGRSEGNLGNMPMFDSLIGSPPFENSYQDVNSTEGRIELARARGIDNCEYVTPIEMKRVNGRNQQYGGSDGQMGNEAGETFWAAARLIVEQCHQVLSPGSVAVWVTGDFVRDGQRVLFGEQWLALCEAVGFELVEWIVAWKTEYAPNAVTLLDTGGVAAGTAVRYKRGKKERIRPAQKDSVSFFRRMSNERSPEAAILNEDVIIVRKK